MPKLQEFLRTIIFICLSTGIFSCSSSGRVSNSGAYLDEDGTPMKEADFHAKWRNAENGVARWDTVEDGNRVARFSGPRYQTYMLSHPAFRTNMEKLTGKAFDINTIFLIEYRYKDDQCSSRYSNTWDPSTIKERKEFLNPQKKQLEEEYANLRFFHFFEEGIELSNEPESEQEYFFRDQENFLRNTIFKNPSLCGSFAIVKPSGEVLVYNGESRPDQMAKHLEETSWELFFEEN